MNFLDNFEVDNDFHNFYIDSCKTVFKIKFFKIHQIVHGVKGLFSYLFM